MPSNALAMSTDVVYTRSLSRSIFDRLRSELCDPVSSRKEEGETADGGLSGVALHKLRRVASRVSVPSPVTRGDVTSVPQSLLTI